MSRNPKLEAFLEARFELDAAPPGQKAAKRAILQALAEDLLKGFRSVSVRELTAITEEAYQEFRKQRFLETQRRLSRLR